MKKIILTGILGSAALLVGCTNNTSVEKGQSVLGGVKESGLEQKGTQTIDKRILGEYDVEYKIIGRDDYMIFSVSSEDNGSEAISVSMPLKRIDGKLYKEQLEIIKNELKIAKKDIEKLEKAITDFFNGEYEIREDIMMEIREHNQDRLYEDEIIYREHITNNKNYRIDLNIYGAEKEYIKVDFIGKRPSDYFNKSGLKYTSYSMHNDDITMNVYRVYNCVKDNAMDAVVTTKVDKLESEKFQEVFTTACAKVGIDEKDVKRMHKKIKTGKGRAGFSLELFQEITIVTDEKADICVYYIQEEREGETYRTVYLENEKVE